MRNNVATNGSTSAHHICFLSCVALSLLALRGIAAPLLALSIHDDRYSHVLFVPLISIALLCLERRRIFSSMSYSPLQALPILLVGVAIWWIGRTTFASNSSGYGWSLTLAGTICIWIASFMLCYGTASFRFAFFPLLFLLLMIPVPLAALDKIVLLLQKGSTTVAYLLFKLIGIPVYRHGFTFTLPGLDIEVAKECSGIRSTIAFFITGLLAGHIFLSSTWTKFALAVLTVPIAIFKNALRIVTISSLGVYVDRAVLYGKLHRYGGLPFGLVALALLIPTLFLLWKAETKSRDKAVRLTEAVSPASMV